jgi:hypothetical protein
MKKAGLKQSVEIVLKIPFCFFMERHPSKFFSETKNVCDEYIFDRYAEMVDIDESEFILKSVIPYFSHVDLAIVNGCL